MSDLEFHSVDARTFVERIFFDLVDGQLRAKKTTRIDCSAGVPDHLPDNRICLLLNFKKGVRRGRKDRLKGKDVIAFPSDKGWILMPFDETMEFGRSVYSYGLSLKNTLEREDEQE